MAKRRLEARLTATPPIPEAAIASAVGVLRSGDLFRYAPTAPDAAHAAALEAEFAAWCGRRFAVALNSCGSTMFVALKALGVQAGEPVLFNAFTLAPVPGAIEHAGGRAIAVDCRADLLIDLDDLAAKANQSGAKVLLLSHMRGHIADMEAVAARCDELGLALIEDCAHTMGASWAGRLTGTFGAIGCFSTQSYKHLNSGEGGLLVTDDAEVAAHAILRSGSYALYEQHRARPDAATFERLRTSVPNCSLRMSNLVAALLRPQLADLEARCTRWRAIHDRIEAGLREAAERLPITLIRRDTREEHVPSSLQFALPSLSDEAFSAFFDACEARGLPLKSFVSKTPIGYSGRCEHWSFIEPPQLARLPAILDRLVDFRLPLTLGDDDCDLAVEIIADSLEASTPHSA